jgi:hypothetical protein
MFGGTGNGGGDGHNAQTNLSASSQSSEPVPGSWWGIRLLGFYLVFVIFVLCYLLIILWPHAAADGNAPSEASSAPVELLGNPWFTIHVTPEMRRLLLVIVAGAIGSCLHAVTSFVDFVGNRRFIASWLWWYLLRPITGVTLALVFYFAVRAGFFTASADPKSINTFGVVAISSLAGLFAKQATDKLDELFTTMFRTDPSRGDSRRRDQLEQAALPRITGIAPTEAPVGGRAVDLTVNGLDFVKSSVVLCNGAERATTFVTANQLKARLVDDDLTTQGELEVRVYSPGGGLSKPLMLRIVLAPGAAGHIQGDVAVDHPAPTLERLDPDHAVAGADAIKVTAHGKNFAATSSVRWGTSDRPALAGSTATELHFDVTKADLQAINTVSVAIVNPEPNSGLSSALPFRITQT